MNNEELATLANISVKADLCNYQGEEWQQCINDLQKLIAGRYNTAFEVLARLRCDDWERDVTGRSLLNFYLELNLMASQYINKQCIHELEL